MINTIQPFIFGRGGEKVINKNELYIVHYCHPNCKPFQNIMRLPKEQAFKRQKSLQKIILKPKLFTALLILKTIIHKG